MVVKESQSGSSFMAGGALSAGAGIPIGPVSLGVGGAFGAGGASADSEGMRSIVGDTTQKISDAFHQATSAQRELNWHFAIDRAEELQELYADCGKRWRDRCDGACLAEAVRRGWAGQARRGP
jgi:hypothetical protein